jgi:hypothetical protein
VITIVLLLGVGGQFPAGQTKRVMTIETMALNAAAIRSISRGIHRGFALP